MLVTIIGAGPGISRAIAKRFGEEGYTIALVSRSEDKLKAEAAGLAEKGIRADYAVADAGDAESLLAALNDLAERHGLADVYVYNAYKMNMKGLEAETWESVRQQMDVNVGGAFQLLQWALPRLKERNSGSLFITGGGLGQHPHPMFAGLAMGKAALRNLVLGTAQTLKGSAVHLATVTVNGYVREADPKYNPTLIAEEFWKLHSQAPGEYQVEVSY